MTTFSKIEHSNGDIPNPLDFRFRYEVTQSTYSINGNTKIVKCQI